MPAPLTLRDFALRALVGLLLAAFGGVYLAANPVRVPGAGGGPSPAAEGAAARYVPARGVD